MSLLRASTHLARATRHATRNHNHVRLLTTDPAPLPANASPEKEKRFVRIAGPAAYASTQDMALFLESHGVPAQDTKQSLVQGQSDIFQNHTVWFFETKSQDDATDISARISGRVLGLKLVRAAPVDKRLFHNMVGTPDAAPSGGGERRASLRKRMSVIAPQPDERGRTLLARNLVPNMQPRLLWSFFSAYDVADIRMLRKPGIASIIFDSAEEANRALRERSNLYLQNQQQVQLKMHV